MNNNKVCFFLLGSKGLHVLEQFIGHYGNNAISLVIAARDIAIANDFYDEIKQLCSSNGIGFADRKDLKEEMIDTEYSFAISWRWLIHSTHTKLIVLHDSLLPAYRGYAPLVSMLENAETELGVTALYADVEYDMGNILFQSRVSITYPIRIKEAIDILHPCYWECVRNVYQDILEEKDMKGAAQDKSSGSYSMWRDESDYFIDWSASAESILRFIHATGYPYKGAATMMEDKKIRVLDAEVMEDVTIENRKPGKIIFSKDNYPVVACGKGLLKILNAISESDNMPVLPLNRFRIKFS